MPSIRRVAVSDQGNDLLPEIGVHDPRKGEDTWVLVTA